MIVIPDNDPSDYELWAAIVELSRLPVRWTLVGGQMVRVHANLAGSDPPSATADADAVADVRAVPDAIVAIVGALRAMGFTQAAGSGRFVKHAEPLPLKFDVLIPENVGERTERRVHRTLQTVSAPGATQALARSESIQVELSGKEHTVPVPGLLGAMILKACAVDLRITDDERFKHKRDFVFLLSLVDDPLGMHKHVDAKDRQRLATADRRIPADDAVWDGLGPATARRARNTLTFLMR